MNEIFKKAGKEVIVLDENYTLSHDGFKGVALTFSEEREREKETKIDGKKVKTGEIEKYSFEDKYYYPTLGQALKRYVELSQNSAKDLKEIAEKTDKILAVVEDFKKFKNW